MFWCACWFLKKSGSVGSGCCSWDADSVNAATILAGPPPVPVPPTTPPCTPPTTPPCTPPLTPPSTPPSSPSSSSFFSSSTFGCTSLGTSDGWTTLVSVFGVCFFSVFFLPAGGGGGGGGGGAEKNVSETAGGAISSTWKNDQTTRTMAATPCSSRAAISTARRI